MPHPPSASSSLSISHARRQNQQVVIVDRKRVCEPCQYEHHQLRENWVPVLRIHDQINSSFNIWQYGIEIGPTLTFIQPCIRKSLEKVSMTNSPQTKPCAVTVSFPLFMVVVARVCLPSKCGLILNKSEFSSTGLHGTPLTSDSAFRVRLHRC